MPEYRTTKYATWRACERFGMLPPAVKPAWDDCDVITQSELLAYDCVRISEDAEFQARLAGARV
jgi:hypothetical protein